MSLSREELQLFNNFCGGCHGPTSGKEHDLAVRPDLLTRASKALARSSGAQNLVNVAKGAAKAPPFP